MAVENPQTNQDIEAIVAEARQLRRIQRIDLGVVVGSIASIVAMEVSHPVVLNPHPESLVLKLVTVAIGSIAALRALGCELQGDNLDFRAIVAVMEEASRRTPSLGNDPQSV